MVVGRRIVMFLPPTRMVFSLYVCCGVQSSSSFFFYHSTRQKKSSRENFRVFFSDRNYASLYTVQQYRKRRFVFVSSTSLTVFLFCACRLFVFVCSCSVVAAVARRRCTWLGCFRDITHTCHVMSQGTPFEGGTFQINIDIPSGYPFEPPKMKFVTKIWHPNISSQTGAICLVRDRAPPSRSYTYMNIYGVCVRVLSSHMFWTSVYSFR